MDEEREKQGRGVREEQEGGQVGVCQKVFGENEKARMSFFMGVWVCSSQKEGRGAAISNRENNAGAGTLAGGLCKRPRVGRRAWG